MDIEKSCVVAQPRERNCATNTPQNATINATEMQSNSLKALALRVLERNQHNQARNSCATGQLHGPQIYATLNNSNATHGITAILEKHGLNIEELIQYAGEDWADIKGNLPAINSLAALITDIRLRAEGKLPPRYTAQAHCQGCGDVWLPPSLANANLILSCPWCFNRVHKLPIPTFFIIGENL